MTTILSSYDVNEGTMSLLPVAHVDYHTIILERGQQLYVRKTPVQLIQASCLENSSTYEGRRAAVMHHIGIKRKVPILINPSKNIFTFPTHSPTDFACCWIFHSHVQDIKPFLKKPNFKSIVTFKNGQNLQMDVSNYILERQFQRTGMWLWKFA